MARAAAQHTPTRARNHAPAARDPLRLRMEKAVERMLAAAERLITELDALDNPDDEDSFDAEQTAVESFGTGFYPDRSPDDSEDSDPAGGDINDEGHDEEPDREPSLGWTLEASERGLKLNTEGDWSGDLELDPTHDDGKSVYLTEQQRAANLAARREGQALAMSAFGERGGRLIIRDPDAVRILGEHVAARVR